MNLLLLPSILMSLSGLALHKAKSIDDTVQDQVVEGFTEPIRKLDLIPPEPGIICQPHRARRQHGEEGRIDRLARLRGAAGGLGDRPRQRGESWAVGLGDGRTRYPPVAARQTANAAPERETPTRRK